ncbi:MAG: type 4a pilus biogenesis protein PilO [Thermodesulfobacteriota bacterium]
MRLAALTELLQRLRVVDRKTLLYGVAGLLLLLNLGRFGWLAVEGWQESIDDRVEQLAKYRKAVNRIDTLKGEVAALEGQHQTLTSYLFTGASEEEAASAMQVALQDEVVKAGLEPEFIQPTPSEAATKPEPTKKEGIRAISIKLRLGGTLNNFGQFVQELYRAKKLFTIENCTVKPLRKEDLKIYLEVKGYYAIPAAGAQPKR